MLKAHKTFSVRRTIFDIGADVSTSWPQLWFVVDKKGYKSWLPFALKVTDSGDGGWLVTLILGPLRLFVGWM